MEYINKTILVLLFSVCLLETSCFCQEVKTDSTDEIIKNIRKEFSKINSDTAKFRVVQQDMNDQSAEGGTMKKYYDGNVLRKAILTFYGETGQSTSEYYFSNGQLFFCFERTKTYSQSISAGKTTVSKIEENRYYFNGQRLIRWINSSGKITNKNLYPVKEKEVLADLKDIH